MHTDCKPGPQRRPRQHPVPARSVRCVPAYNPSCIRLADLAMSPRVVSVHASDGSTVCRHLAKTAPQELQLCASHPAPTSTWSYFSHFADVDLQFRLRTSRSPCSTTAATMAGWSLRLRCACPPYLGWPKCRVAALAHLRVFCGLPCLIWCMSSGTADRPLQVVPGFL